MIAPVLPELRRPDPGGEPFTEREYSSAEAVIGRRQLAALLEGDDVLASLEAAGTSPSVV